MEHYKLSFSVNSKTIEISSHDKSWVEKKETEYKDEIVKLLTTKQTHLQAKDKSSEIITSQKTEVNPSISINEFYRKYIHETKISSRPDIATYFVYYLTKIKKQEEIAPTDVKDCFKDSGYPNWNKINISDVLSKAKNKAFLNYHNNQWTLTITGEDFVINKLSEMNEK